jgi:hypothetical protein
MKETSRQRELTHSVLRASIGAMTRRAAELSASASR